MELSALPKKDEIVDFSKILDGNPVMLEIWSDAQNRIDEGIPLGEVQKVVIREWLNMARAKAISLELKSQRDMLSDESYAELAALREEISRMEEFV